MPEKIEGEMKKERNGYLRFDDVILHDLDELAGVRLRWTAANGGNLSDLALGRVQVSWCDPLERASDEEAKVDGQDEN